MFYQFHMGYGEGVRQGDRHIFNCKADSKEEALRQVSYYIERGWKVYECRLFVTHADMLGDEAETSRSLKRKSQRLARLKREIAARGGFAFDVHGGGDDE